jgi:MinD-like ATPase involved in chromosome partitioning or flagellar assembly
MPQAITAPDPSPPSRTPGLVCTFYSYKGGVGRSMALANIAAMLARWDQKVLVIDWDLEAPGLERFFGDRVRGSRRDYDGLIDIVASFGKSELIDWRRCLLRATIPQGTTVDILHAGREGDTYVQRLRETNWEALFEGGFGNVLEEMRAEWTREYDYVLIDSRTGITDIGGICTILMPDYLVSLFTTNGQSVQGVRDTMVRARERQGNLPLKRRRMVIIPIAARDESATEYQRAAEWRNRSAAALESFYSDWIHKDETPESVLDYLKIPYVAFWSFGEQLPVLEEDPQNPKNLAYSYALIARLIHSRLDWTEVREGRKTSELQQQREAATQVRLAESAQVRAESQAKLQAEAEREVARREDYLLRRYSHLGKTARTQGLVSAIGAIISLGVALAVGSIFMSVTSLQSMTPVGWIVLGVGVLSLPLSTYFAMLVLRSNRRVQSLEREYAAYSLRSGEYANRNSADNLVLFSERIEEIVAGSMAGRSTATTAAQPPPPSSIDRANPVSPPPAPSIGPVAATTTIASSMPSPPSVASLAPADVFIDYADGGLVGDWMREFAPLLRAWLSESLGRDVTFLDRTQMPAGTNWESWFKKSIAEARVLLVVATPRYFSSVEGTQELADAAGLSSGRLFVVSLDRNSMSAAPHWLQSQKWTDFSDLAYVGEGFSKTERYIEFQDRIRKLASEMADRLRQMEQAEIEPQSTDRRRLNPSA